MTRTAILVTLGAVLLSGCTHASPHRTTGTASPTSPAAAGSLASGAAASAAGPAEPVSPGVPATPTASTAAPPTPTTQAIPASPTNPATPSPQAPSQSEPATATFVATSATVTAAELGKSWHPGCPVGPGQLRTVTLTYWGFDNAPHAGKLVVAASVVRPAIQIFATLFQDRFPIRSVQPTADFGGSDDASMAADNTSGFNCRYAVAQGPPQWSAHAYGKAIDVNTVENPYLEGGKVLPPQGAPYLKRTPYRPGMAVAGGALVRAFATAGWQWGGRWTSSPDYQHFSADGG